VIIGISVPQGTRDADDHGVEMIGMTATGTLSLDPTSPTASRME
jgi:hypothetical protein